jgi:predicted O-methyltransferase YrrM
MSPLTKQEVVELLVSAEPAFHHADGQDQVWHAGAGTLSFIAETTGLGDRTIETGVGASTVAFAAAGARHVAVSPEPREHHQVAAFCDEQGVAIDQVDFRDGYAEEVLPSLPASARFDLAFIDGKHSFPYPILDWHYLNRHLRVGGVMLMDDVAALAPEMLCRRMLVDSAWRFLAALDGEAVAFEKLAEPPADDPWRDEKIAPAEELARLLSG